MVQVQVHQHRQLGEESVRDCAFETVPVQQRGAQRRDAREHGRELADESVSGNVQKLELAKALERRREGALELVAAEVEGLEVGEGREIRGTEPSSYSRRGEDAADARVARDPREGARELVRAHVQQTEVVALIDGFRELAGEPGVREGELLERVELADPRRELPPMPELPLSDSRSRLFMPLHCSGIFPLS